MCGRSGPSFGSWVTYGLGSENQNLPGFIVLCPDGLPTQGNQNWRSAFLPGAYQATQIDTREKQDREADREHPQPLHDFARSSAGSSICWRS